MKLASVADVKAKFSSYVKASAEGPIVITRNGRAVAAIVSVGSDDDLERLLLGYSSKLRSILAKSHQQIAGGQGIPHDEFWKEVASKGNKK